MRSFGSDNHAGVDPHVLEAMVQANQDHAIAYGHDPWTQRALALFEEIFGGTIETNLVFSGTGANLISLALGLRSYNAVICAHSSHINTDECAGPENFTGAKLLALPSADGKLAPRAIEEHLGRGDEHHAQPRMVSISQANEFGLVYSASEIRALAECAHRHKLYVHMDGARLANAAVHLNLSLQETTRDLGVDILSFGGTKNGMMFGEAVVVFNPDLFGAGRYVRKQAAQLASKMRFIAAQFLALLEHDRWRENAERANRAARLLADRLTSVPGIRLSRPVQANGVFAILPSRAIEILRRRHFFYVWNEQQHEVRWMTSFDTTEADVEEFVKDLRDAVRESRIEN
jgi:threonine aldolase